MHQLHQFILWVVDLVGHWGYGGIFLLMCLESTVVPIPSELVMPPAGYLAFQGHMNIWLATLMGTLGSAAGASINYGVAIWLGRPLILKYGKFFLCPPHKFEKVERFFLRHGEIGTFTGRLILGIRHFISLPAGLARMRMSHFLGFTIAGSAIWCGLLAALGYWIGQASQGRSPEEIQALFQKHGKTAGLAATLACGVLIAGYILWQRSRRPRA